MEIFSNQGFVFICRGSLTKALVKTLSKIILANGGEISEPEKADIAVVGRVEKGNEKETPFRLPKRLLSERDKLTKTCSHCGLSHVDIKMRQRGQIC